MATRYDPVPIGTYLLLCTIQCQRPKLAVGKKTSVSSNSDVGHFLSKSFVAIFWPDGGGRHGGRHGGSVDSLPTVGCDGAGDGVFDVHAASCDSPLSHNVLQHLVAVSNVVMDVGMDTGPLAFRAAPAGEKKVWPVGSPSWPWSSALGRPAARLHDPS